MLAATCCDSSIMLCARAVVPCRESETIQPPPRLRKRKKAPCCHKGLRCATSRRRDTDAKRRQMGWDARSRGAQGQLPLVAAHAGDNVVRALDVRLRHGGVRSRQGDDACVGQWRRWRRRWWRRWRESDGHRRGARELVLWAATVECEADAVVVFVEDGVIPATGARRAGEGAPLGGRADGRQRRARGRRSRARTLRAKLGQGCSLGRAAPTASSSARLRRRR